ncbi:putative F-box protein [Cocos nucifera]|nr:putative F-box protein [Cocos nucifera]
MVTMKTEERMIDWSNLPSDIAKLIVERVATNLADYIKFRAVCPSCWTVTVDPCHLNFPPQLPWLRLETRSANALPFISISDVKPRSLSPSRSNRLIHLPPLPPCEDIYDEDTRMLAIAIPSVPTSSSANSTIMAIVGHPTMSMHDPEAETPTMLIGLRSGSSAWTIVNKTLTFQDVIYHKESFYTTTLSGLVLVSNAELEEVMGVRVPVISYMSPWRLVESSDGQKKCNRC